MSGRARHWPRKRSLAVEGIDRRMFPRSEVSKQSVFIEEDLRVALAPLNYQFYTRDAEHPLGVEVVAGAERDRRRLMSVYISTECRCKCTTALRG
jgi:hypothetical protein